MGRRLPPPLGYYPGKSGTYPGKIENIRANQKMKTNRTHYTLGNISF